MSDLTLSSEDKEIILEDLNGYKNNTINSITSVFKEKVEELIKEFEYYTTDERIQKRINNIIIQAKYEFMTEILKMSRKNDFGMSLVKGIDKELQEYLKVKLLDI